MVDGISTAQSIEYDPEGVEQTTGQHPKKLILGEGFKHGPPEKHDEPTHDKKKRPMEDPKTLPEYQFQHNAQYSKSPGGDDHTSGIGITKTLGIECIGCRDQNVDRNKVQDSKDPLDC